MGKIQSSINSLIYQTAALFGKDDKKDSSEKIKYKEAKIRSQLALAQEREERVKNNQIKGQILEQRLKTASAKATARANEEIQAKYMQKNNFKDRHAQALQRRMNLTEPHKPLPKKEE